MIIVFRDREGRYAIGPLTEEQYSSILCALELAAAWSNRGKDYATAQAFRDLIPFLAPPSQDNAPKL